MKAVVKGITNETKKNEANLWTRGERQRITRRIIK